MYLDAGSENKHILYSESFEQHTIEMRLGDKLKEFLIGCYNSTDCFCTSIYFFLMSVNISVIRKHNNYTLLHFDSFVKNEICFSVQIT